MSSNLHERSGKCQTFFPKGDPQVWLVRLWEQCVSFNTIQRVLFNQREIITSKYRKFESVLARHRSLHSHNEVVLVSDAVRVCNIFTLLSVKTQWPTKFPKSWRFFFFDILFMTIFALCTYCFSPVYVSSLRKKSFQRLASAKKYVRSFFDHNVYLHVFLALVEFVFSILKHVKYIPSAIPWRVKLEIQINRNCNNNIGIDDLIMVMWWWW